jgi:phage shock protein PspC (stress-responsive transcriptional regulator)
MSYDRAPDALLAGVCSGIARTFKWNVWVIRALFVGFLALETLTALLIYAGLALVFHLAERHGRKPRDEVTGISSPELSGRKRRIEELERRFRELEGSD